MLHVIWLASFIACAASAAEPQGGSSSMKPTLDDLRQFYLSGIHELRSYRPGKNSFVEGPDRRLGCYRAPGQRLTLLDIAGSGSVRHIWSTWRENHGNHRLEFFADGAKKPALVGTLDELIAATQRAPSPPVSGFIGNKGARNLFLPVPFKRHMRIEMETLEPAWLIFYQIDYRTGDKTSPAPARSKLQTQPVHNSVTIPANGKADIATLAGPAIVRRWQMKTDVNVNAHNLLRLEARYDAAATPAVRSNLADFFGPFRGVSFETDTNTAARVCHLPMPFRRNATFTLANDLPHPVTVTFDADIEPVRKWSDHWGYFHALWQQTPRTTGYRQHQVLYLRGRGHWLGMALYGTGHDHGGGDFAVIDGEGDSPAFLHGINGEDYFTFAWFGRGAHHPFAVAHSNEAGRYRHHFENPYPFQKSFSLYWGTYPDLAPRSVAYWYQDSPEDTTVTDAGNPLNADWDCFGPVPLPLDKNHRPAGDPYAVLPSVADLDAGKQFECRCVSESFVSGWMKQRSIGPMLDLTYLARHGTKIKGEVELGGMGHAFLARRVIASPKARRVTFQISHDDPLRVLVNGREVYHGDGSNGFVTHRFPVKLKAGDNEVVVQLTNFFNVNFNWAGFSLRLLE
jgi:hypothetical protein